MQDLGGGAAAAALLAAPAVARAIGRARRPHSVGGFARHAGASQQLLETLEKNLGQKVQGFVASDYNGVIEALRANHLEVAYLGPFSYVLGTTIAPIEAFATAETAKSGRTYYHSQIITRVDSGIKTINDLKGTHLRVRRSVLDLGPSVPESRPDQDRHRSRQVFRPRAVHRLA